MAKITIGILYHFVPPDVQDKYFSKEHLLVDNETYHRVLYVEAILLKAGYAVKLIPVTPEDVSGLTRNKVDYFFNMVDSKEMEMPTLALLSKMKIPYSGSSFDAVGISNDKIKMKKLFDKYNLATPKYKIIRPQDRIGKWMVPGNFPVIVKPAYEHCSIGITDSSVVGDYKELVKIVRNLGRKMRQALIIEEFIEGREFHATVLEANKEAVVLPLAELIFTKEAGNQKWRIYGFDEKWSEGTLAYKGANFISPPKNIPEEKIEEISKEAARAFWLLKMEGYGRFDLRYGQDAKTWYFLEANANPGFDPNPREAMTASILAYGMTLEQFILQIVKNDIEKYF